MQQLCLRKVCPRATFDEESFAILNLEKLRESSEVHIAALGFIRQALSSQLCNLRVRNCGCQAQAHRARPQCQDEQDTASYMLFHMYPSSWNAQASISTAHAID